MIKVVSVKEKICAGVVFVLAIAVMTAALCYNIRKVEGYKYANNYWGMSKTQSYELSDGVTLTEVLPASGYSFDGIQLREFNSNGSFSGDETLHVVLSNDATGEVYNDYSYMLKNHQFDDANVFIPCVYSNAEAVALQVDLYTTGVSGRTISVALSDTSAVGGAFYVNDVPQENLHFCMNYVIISAVQNNMTAWVYYICGVLAASALLALCLTGKLKFIAFPGKCESDAKPKDGADKTKSRERLMFYLGVFVVMNGFFLLFFYKILKSLDLTGGPVRKYFALIGLIGVAGANLVLILAAFGKARITTIYIVSALILGTAFCFLIPSYCVQDERFHLDQAYIMSNEWLGVEETTYPNRIYKRTCDIDGSVEATMEVTELEYSVICGRLFDKVDAAGEQLELAYAVTDGVRTAPQISYLPQAIGTTYARVMHYNLITTTFFARMANLVAITILMALALRKMPFGKKALAATMLLPMTLLLSASASYDGFIIASAFFFAAYCLDAAYNPEKCSVLSWSIMILSAALLAMSKGGVYIPIIGLVVFLSRPAGNGIASDVINAKALKKSKIFRNLGVFALALVVVLAAAIKLYPTINETLEATGFNNENIYEARTLYNVQYALANFGKVVGIVFWSLIRKSYQYTRGMLGTQLGLSVRLPAALSIGYLILLVLSALKSDKKELSLTIKRKIFTAILVVVSVLIIMVSMLFAVTDIKDEMIRGVQGRYFLPLLPLVLLLIKNNKIVTTRVREGDIILAVTILNVITLGLAMSAIVAIEAF